jgi:hypothetical protein
MFDQKRGIEITSREIWKCGSDTIELQGFDTEEHFAMRMLDCEG